METLNIGFFSGTLIAYNYFVLIWGFVFRVLLKLCATTLFFYYPWKEQKYSTMSTFHKLWGNQSINFKINQIFEVAGQRYLSLTCDTITT